jgi:hypothetical protein
MTVSQSSLTAAPTPGDRPSNPEVENENQRSPGQDGKAPRPATEPKGAGRSSQSPETRTDPGSGEDA